MKLLKNFIEKNSLLLTLFKYLELFLNTHSQT